MTTTDILTIDVALTPSLALNPTQTPGDVS